MPLLTSPLFVALCAFTHAPISGVWVQTSLSYVLTSPNSTPLAIQNNQPNGYAISAVAGQDGPHSHNRTGDSPSPDPNWYTEFGGAVGQATVTQNWFFSGQTIPAYSQLSCVVHWNREVGYQEFSWQVEGVSTGDVVSRRIDWWTPKGSEVIISPWNPGGSGD